jgi:predicted transcriptional regulator
LMVASGINLHGPQQKGKGEDIRVADIMSASTAGTADDGTPLSVSPSDKLEEILYLFSHYGYERLPVTEGDKTLGTIERASVLKALFPEDQARQAD